MESIQLMSAEFNEWMESVELRLTRTKDELSLLESEERKLSGIWESGAREQWHAGFQEELLEIRRFIVNMGGLLQKTQESAEALSKVEKGLIAEAESV